MKNFNRDIHPNQVIQYLNKPQKEITKKDLINFVLNNGIQMINFRFVGGDSRLKTLNFIITSKKQLDLLLSKGERVDGSSLFSYIDSNSSDLYVIPRFKTAYLNPFSEIPTLEMLCCFSQKKDYPSQVLQKTF